MRKLKEAEAAKEKAAKTVKTIPTFTLETVPEENETRIETANLSGQFENVENFSGHVQTSDEPPVDPVWNEQEAMDAIKTAFGGPSNDANVSRENIFLLVCKHCVEEIEKPYVSITQLGPAKDWPEWPDKRPDEEDRE